MAHLCICGDIMAGISSPDDCSLFGTDCTPEHPVGACMVSNEGTCKIWLEYGGAHPAVAFARAGRESPAEAAAPAEAV